MALYDYYNTGDDSYTTALGIYWKSQSFTASATYSISSVKLKLFRQNSPGTVTVSIRGTDGAGKPTGADIDGVTGTTYGNTLTTDTAGEWREITFSSPILLTSGEQYAIVVRALAGDLTNRAGWRMDTTLPSYAGENGASSSNSGSTWTLYADYDMMFETWGDSTEKELVGSLAGASGLSGSLIRTLALAGSLTGISGLSGALYIPEVKLTGSLAGVSGLAGSLNYLASISGSFSAAASLEAVITISSGATWPAARPGINPDRVFGYNSDESQWGWWSTGELSIAGGSRYKNQIVAIGHKKIYFGAV